MQEGSHFYEYLLPQGIPCNKGDRVRLIRTGEKLSKSKVLSHVKGKGAKGDEKKYQNKAEGLRDKSKHQLYEIAREENVDGRSNMNKEDLVEALSEK